MVEGCTTGGGLQVSGTGATALVVPVAVQPPAVPGSGPAPSPDSILAVLQRQAAQQQALLSQQQLELLQLAEAARVEQQRQEARAAELGRQADELAERERQVPERDWGQ